MASYHLRVLLSMALGPPISDPAGLPGLPLDPLSALNTACFLQFQKCLVTTDPSHPVSSARPRPYLSLSPAWTIPGYSTHPRGSSGNVSSPQRSSFPLSLARALLDVPTMPIPPHRGTGSGLWPWCASLTVLPGKSPAGRQLPAGHLTAPDGAKRHRPGEGGDGRLSVHSPPAWAPARR